MPADIVAGMYQLQPEQESESKGEAQVRLLGSGSLLPQVWLAADLLAQEFNIAAEVWSVTSYTELARDAQAQERWNRLHPADAERSSHLQRSWGSNAGILPVVASSDYVRAYPQLIAPYVSAPFTALGTDGFGRSDTRHALRRFFEVDRQHIVLAALYELARQGLIERSVCAAAIKRYQIDADAPAPWAC